MKDHLIGSFENRMHGFALFFIFVLSLLNISALCYFPVVLNLRSWLFPPWSFLIAAAWRPSPSSPRLKQAARCAGIPAWNSWTPPQKLCMYDREHTRPSTDAWNVHSHRSCSLESFWMSFPFLFHWKELTDPWSLSLITFKAFSPGSLNLTFTESHIYSADSFQTPVTVIYP